MTVNVITMNRLQNDTAKFRPKISLDHDPRSLVDRPILESLDGAETSPGGLDGIFIPVKGRPNYLGDVWKMLDVSNAPIYLLPTEDADVLLPSESLDLQPRILHLDDAGFIDTATRIASRFLESYMCSPLEWDLPTKRNFAVWFAKKQNMERILLLDDDIRGLDHRFLSRGANALDSYLLCGPFVDDFPDTSVVGHIELALGYHVSTFMSGSCLFMRSDCDIGFFPPIYNEDWLFMLPQVMRGRVGALGCISQEPYDPFADPSLATFQEGGEIVAEGLYALASSDRYGDRFDTGTWSEIVEMRVHDLTHLLVRARDEQHKRILLVALEACNHIAPSQCAAFVCGMEDAHAHWNMALKELS